ncbi:MAG: histidine kinase [Acidobacteriaceae bacterium]|nr:histidine kinase [Acidobacteriaceae bacterium]MBV8570687.1 histidine kinase [Acidobacteriaceae bacterium]
MTVSGNWRNPILINTVGHTAGALLFAFIIGLLIHEWRTHGMRQTRLSILAALLALGWNVGSLIVLGSPYPASSPIIEFVVTASFSMLSLLPAVLLQVALQGQQRFLVASGYVVSACAIGLHFGEPFFAVTRLHQAGLIAIVFGFAVLTATAFALRRQRGKRDSAEKSEWISLGCLLLFTSSFLHFGYQHLSSPWAAEIAWHHIGIPVALIVLLRDYRLLLLDTFIRFLVNTGLAAVYVTIVLLLNEKFRLWEWVRHSMFLTGVTLVGLCVLLISFAALRNSLQAWVSRAIFRRQNVDDCARAIANLPVAARSEEELLAQAGQLIAGLLGAERFAITAESRQQTASLRPSIVLGEHRGGQTGPNGFYAEAQLPLRFSSGDARCLILGSRRGGRRYRSDDLDDLRHLGAAVVEQVERFRAEELRRLVNQAELRALQAQINPHFLFNALNTLYGTIDRNSRDARRMVINLAEIFRYFLRGHQALIPLSEEMRIVTAYLEIEALRLGDRLQTELIISDSVRSTLIPILSIQLLVENAVKHGVGLKQGFGKVSVTAERAPAGLQIRVEDTGIGFERSQTQPHDGTGLGLENVRRRLFLCYGSSAELQIQSSDAGTTVSFLVPDLPRAEQVDWDRELDSDPLVR